MNWLSIILVYQLQLHGLLPRALQPACPPSVGISVLPVYIDRNEFLAMLGAFHDVIRRFLATDRVDELFNGGANELRFTPAPIRRALELRLFGKFHSRLQKALMSFMRLAMALKIF